MRLFRPAITLKASGIKCDAEGCDYLNDTVSFHDYGKWLNRPCPKCGSNLLTQADLTTLNRIMKFVRFANFILFPWAILSWIIGSSRIGLRIKMNGTGKIETEDLGKART